MGQGEAKITSIDTIRDTVKAADMLSDVKKLKAIFIEQSNIDGEAGKAALAETLAMQVIYQRLVFSQIASGVAKAEVMRSFPAIGSGIRRIAAEMGIAQTDPDSGLEFLKEYVDSHDDDEKSSGSSVRA